MFPKYQERVPPLVAQGLSNKEIGARLGLKEGTVKQYLSRICEQLGLHSRWELIVWWLRNVEMRGRCDTCLLRRVHLEGVECAKEDEAA